MRQHRLAAAIALVGLVLAGCDKQASVELKTPAQKASYGIGLNMGKSLAQEGMDDLDSKAAAQGIEDAIGKKEQKLKDEELAEAFAFLQKRAEDRMAKLNEESAAAGKKFLRDFEEVRAQAQREVMRYLTPDEQRTVAEGMALLVTAAQRHADEHR